MEKQNAVYTITENQSPEEARREHVMLVARNVAAGAAAALFLASFALADIHKLLRAAAYFLCRDPRPDGRLPAEGSAEGTFHGLLLWPPVHIARFELSARGVRLPSGNRGSAVDFRKKRCNLPGRCGHRPLQSLGEFALPCKFPTQSVFTAITKMQLLSNSVYRNRRRVVQPRRVRSCVRRD